MIRRNIRNVLATTLFMLVLISFAKLVSSQDEGFYNTENQYVNVDNFTLFSNASIYLISPTDTTILETGNIRFEFVLSSEYQSNFCNIILDEEILISDLHKSDNTTYYAVFNVAEGDHAFEILCWNKYYATKSNTYRFRVNIKPVLDISSPKNNKWYNSSTLTLLYDAHDYFGIKYCIFDSDNISFYLDTNITSHEFYNLSDGQYNWNITCYDNYNLSNSSNLAFYVDTTPPSLSTTNVTSTSEDNKYAIGFIVDDNLDETINCTLIIDGQSLNSVTAIAGQNNSFILYNLSDGSHSYRIECNDDASNVNVSDETYFAINQSFKRFNLITDKNEYVLGETVNITIYAPNNSSSNLRIGWNSGDNEVYTSNLGNKYPTSYLFHYTENPGNYTIYSNITFLNSVYNLMRSFMVVNNMQLSMVSDKSTADINEQVQFNVTMNGGIKPYTYRWSFGDEINSTEKNPKHIYSVEGSYTVKLYVTDAHLNAKNTELSVDVRKRFNITFTVKENGTSLPLKGATILLANWQIYTRDNGNVVQSIPRGSYYLEVSRKNYSSYDYYVNVDSDKTIEVILNREDRTPPGIKLMVPENKRESRNPVEFKYSVTDDSRTNCSLFILENSGWWKLYASKISTGADMFSISLPEGERLWIIECVDEKLNMNRSEERIVVVNNSFEDNKTLEAETKSGEEDILEFEAKNIEDAIEIDSLSPDQAEVFISLGYAKKMEEYTVALQRHDRDIANMKYRKLTLEEAEKAKAEIDEKLFNQSDLTPKEIDVLNSHTFVKYAIDSNFQDSVKEYLKSINKTLNGNELESYINDLQVVNSNVEVHISAKNVRVVYLSGREEIFSMVKKEIFSTNSLNNSADLRIIEIFPKELVQSSDEITFLTPDTVIQKDPILEFTNISNPIAYKIEKQLKLEKVPAIQSLVLPKSFETDKQKTSFITAFTIFKKLDMTEKKKKMVFFELLVVFILSVIYMSFYFATKRTEGSDENNEKIKQLRKLISNAELRINQGNIEEASVSYEEIDLVYRALDGQKKSEFYPKIQKISNTINKIYIEKLIKNAFDLLRRGDTKSAEEIYDKISYLYVNMPDEVKNGIFDDCIKLNEGMNKTENA